MKRILSVDDEPINLIIIAECLRDDHYQIDEAEDGEAAWDMICANHYDLLILDRMMPRLDGISLLRRIKADPAHQQLPVIMQTAASGQNEVREGLAAGAHYYLTKPYEPEALRILVSTVLKDQGDREEIRQSSDALSNALLLLTEGEFVYQTLKEAHNLAATLASLCADRDSASVGLIELLVNAIEHGNLCITYQEKAALRKHSAAWEAEVSRRLALPEYAARRARVKFLRDGDTLEFTIRDEGEGFDWQPFLDFDPSRAFDLNGRGIAMANKFSFTEMQYLGKGNVVRTRALARQPD